jgi:predicted nucleic acid-binding protein
MILDSSVLIAAERGMLDLDERLALAPEEPVAIAAITASELLLGVASADGSARRTKRLAFVEWVLGNIRLIPFGLPEARVHSRLWAEMRAAGAGVGAHDLLIAATAVAGEERLITRDARHFARVPGLRWERW